jgi:hypothetical protein
MSETTERVGVEIRIVEITPTRGSGRLMATATVLVAVCDVEIIIAGCQIKLTHDGRWLVQGPQWRDPRSGKWLPAVILPPELSAALGLELTDAMELRNDLLPPVL